MKNLFPYIFLTFIFSSCSGRYETKTEVSDLFPQSCEIIIKINALNNLSKSTHKELLLDDLKNDSLLKSLQSLNFGESQYIGIVDNASVFFTEKSKDLILKDSTLDIETTKLPKSEIYKTVFNKDTIYLKVIDSFFMGSKNLSALRKIKKQKNTELRNLLNASNPKAAITIINKKKNNLLLSEVDSIYHNSNDLIDINFDARSIYINGTTKGKDSLFYLDTFKNTKPQEFNIAKIIPANIKSIERIAFDDFSVFRDNLQTIHKTSFDSIPNFLNYVNEIAQIDLSNSESAIAINTLDIELITDELGLDNKAEDYKGVSIFRFQNQTVFSEYFKPFIEVDKVSYFFITENFVVFSDKLETLKNIISSKLNNQVFSSSEKYETLSENLVDESSYLIYKNEETLSHFLNTNTTDYNANIVQYTYDNDFAHINGVFSKFKKQAAAKTVTEDFTVNLSSEILLQPQTVKNHRNKTNEIVVQDINNRLYLISNSGKILWKKQLNGPVLGEIKQIDIYRNNRLQLAFATPNNVYVIDRNGKDVGPFPLKFSDKITQPLSVFDYDNQKNYRLLVTQDKSLLMYDTKAKRVGGFKYNGAKESISSQPKHFRISSKDYIVFSQGSKLEILNRQGKERISTKGSIDFSSNEIYDYQNKFTTLTKRGELAQVDTKGQINLKNLGLNADTEITTTNKTLVALTENKLKIKSRVLDLDYGNYTTPKIFYLQDKIYITTTDLQTKKVYVFDSQAKLLPNFPVYGTSTAVIDNLDNKRNPELITLGDSSTIIVYKMN
ncbi:hypothetical protein [Winogradskyella jejuensis]|uniref:Uncharacterized protein n=1 Tax=Winogradskyella jejuensis TaxID=1089305 RepID=A0A1M5PPE2_9FLAO|nr:hypothetical protein [Winogradskyella jejuensis]SHH03604.1 hypothetical protein SAMN05444148_1552 [Winogradskyella jejuensis]